MESLASKYRPKKFEDVVGQDHIKTILMNQIQAADIKQAYLFTGGAGTGKTTNARIFAREIDSEIIEIDGASNNGVDNVRELIDSSKFRPLNKKHKTFIIDEVHMLSTGAFNALLKTLEEPPAHAVFILATTDPQKIPATILSRVQRFDFKRMTVEQTFKRLVQIIEMENVDKETDFCVYPYYTVSDDVLDYVSKLAQGGMRNAISLLDTCLGYKTDLTLEDIVEIIGATHHDTFISLAYALQEKDAEKILNLIEQLHMSGKDLKQFIKGFMEFIVDVEKYQVLGSMQYISAPALHEDVINALGKYDLMKYFKALSELSNNIKYEQNPKTLIQGELLCLL